MSLVNDANSNEGEKLDPENEADLIDLTSATENISEDETGSSSPLVDLHACGICFQPYNDSERLPKVLSCGHTNCLACLNSWVKHGSSVFPVCAVCRKITHKPVYLLPNNFQLLEVLRRMKLVSMDSPPTFPEQPQNAYSATGSSASEMDAVCEKIDGYMNDIASLLESQMERLRMNEQHPRATVGHNMALRTVEHSIATFLQQWQSTRRCLRFTNNPKFYPRESGSITDLMDLVDLMYADGVFEDDFDFSSHDSLSRSPPGEERPYEYLGSSVSDILPEDFDFSLFEGDNQEAVVSVSLSSSPDDNFPGSDEQVESFTFPYITILDTYSYCTLCHCRIPRNFANYRTHVLGRRHQLNCATEREGNPSGRGRPYNRHRNRHQTRRTHIGFGASGQNTGSRNTPIRMSTSVGVENDTGRIIPSGSPSWLEFAPQRGNDITDDRSSWRDSAETIVANASDRPSGRRNWFDFTTEWRYGWNPDNSSPRTHMQRRNRGAVQSNRGNIEATASRRGNQRPQSSNHGGNIPAGGVSRAPDGSYTFRQPHNRFSTGDSRRLNPGDDRWLDELLTHRRNEVSWLLR